MHLGNSGGSVGTITGAPGDCAASPLASTYIQCRTARLVIGLPATTAASLDGTVPAPTDEDDDDEPQPATISAATTKKAQSAGIDLRDFIKTSAIVAAHSGDAARNANVLLTS